MSHQCRCRWCQREFTHPLPGVNLCSVLCRALESAYKGYNAREQRDPALVSMEARLAAMRAQR